MWVTALKRVLGGAFFFVGVGFALWCAVDMVDADDLSKPPETVARFWGIANQIQSAVPCEGTLRVKQGEIDAETLRSLAGCCEVLKI